MAVGRRGAPIKPAGAVPSPAQMWRKFLELWQYVIDAHSGLPAPHEHTHLATGSDPLATPGTPQALGDTNAAGSGPSYAYEDHVHASGLTTKGDLLTHTGTDNARLARGSDGQALRSRTAATNGIEWVNAPAVSQEAIYLALVM
jgi:hypothetical protein